MLSRSSRFVCVWILVALVGCDASSHTAVSLLHVSRNAQAGPWQEYLMHKKTQGELLTSKFVLNRAKNDNSFPRDISLAELESNIELIVSEEDELIEIRLTTFGRSVPETEKMLDEIVNSFESEVVNRQRLLMVEKLSKLRRRYQSTFDEIVKEAESIAVLRKRTGVAQVPQAKDELVRSRIQFMQRQLFDLQMEKSALDAESNDSPTSQALNRRIEFASQQIEEHISGLPTPDSAPSGEIVARLEVLEALKRELVQIHEAKTKLEIKLDEHSPIAIMQRATCE